MKYLQRLGKSLMLPVACLPVASILLGIGYWIAPIGGGVDSTVAAILIEAGGALINNMSVLFAVGIAFGMSDDGNGTAGLAGLVAWLTITTLLSPEAVATYQRIPVREVNAAFMNVETQFIGIVAGLIGSYCYNRYHKIKLIDALAFFSGKRSVAIFTTMYSLGFSLILFFIWPDIYTSLVVFGKSILSTGAIGAGIYAFLNRLLIPLGLHHSLNSVFWFDVANINDIQNFWSGNGTLGVTGMYMTGFFPIMMFGLPAAAFAMYTTAKKKRKKTVAALLFAAALSSFFTGVTEPLEFSFMFLAPGLYLVHALLTGVSAFVCASLPIRAGFNFSAGLVDYVLSFKAPMALNPIRLIPIGIVFGIIYFLLFRFLILKFNLKTIGREDDFLDIPEEFSPDDFNTIARIILDGVGGKDNVISIDNCITRLRLEVIDESLIDEDKVKKAGISGIIKPYKGSFQVIIGVKVEFVTNEFRKLCE
jgi:PTS system N-acetylglucosamine-specific IIC component